MVSTDSESGAYSIFEGFDAAHPLQIAKENIDLDNVTQDGNHGNESPQAGESPTEYVEAETYNTNIVPSGPEGDAANDVTVTPITGTGSVPTCDIPAFGLPLPSNLCGPQQVTGNSEIKPKGAQDYPERTVPTVQRATPAASAGLRSIS